MCGVFFILDVNLAVGQVAVDDPAELDDSVTVCSTFSTNRNFKNVTCPEDVIGRYLYLIYVSGYERVAAKEVRIHGERVSKY